MTEPEKENSSENIVLLVEDEESHAELIRRVFEERNPSWRIDHAAGIKDATKWLDLNIKKFPFLVISDYNLPDGTGLELAKNARVPEDVGFPLIILTGVGSEKLAVQALKSGVMDYVVKDTEDINLLPRTAIHAIRKWNLIMERKNIEDELGKYIDELEESISNLDDIVDTISQDLLSSTSSIQDFSKSFMENYADKLDDNDKYTLLNIKKSTQKATISINSLIKFMIPVFFDSTLINVYKAKLDELRNGEKCKI
jgi:DNA-binding response OmpR family regulator